MDLRIGVVGSDGDIPDEVRRIAEKIGGDIAANGCILICGGRGGVMEAACKAAKEVGGLTVGILPSLSTDGANPYVDVAITTGLGLARNTVVASSCDVLIAINGREGTLSEIAFALNLGKPVVAVKGSGGIAGEVGKISGSICSEEPEEAVKKALELIKKP